MHRLRLHPIGFQQPEFKAGTAGQDKSEVKLASGVIAKVLEDIDLIIEEVPEVIGGHRI